MSKVSEEGSLLRPRNANGCCSSLHFTQKRIKRAGWQADAVCLNCRGQLASDEVQLLLWQMLHVLKYLHANHVWHRDLKSANVLVKLEGGQRIIKVRHSYDNTFVECSSRNTFSMVVVTLTALPGPATLLLGSWSQTGTNYTQLSSQPFDLVMTRGRQ